MFSSSFSPYGSFQISIILIIQVAQALAGALSSCQVYTRLLNEHKQPATASVSPLTVCDTEVRRYHLPLRLALTSRSHEQPHRVGLLLKIALTTSSGNTVVGELQNLASLLVFDYSVSMHGWK